jgi:hypothetical protein
MDLKKWGGKVWTGCVWLRVGTSIMILTRREISSLAERLLAYQEGFSFVGLVS